MFGTARRVIAKGSSARIKRAWGRGQLCLVPVKIEKGGEKNPAYFTKAEGVEYIA